MFPFQLWLQLPINVRHTIAYRFGIPKKKSTHVVNNEIVDDGYYLLELSEGLSLKRLQKNLNSDIEDYMILWNALISQVTGRPIEIKLPDNSINIIIEPEKKEPEVMKPDPDAPQIKVVTSQFCTQCDSKGVRHKLNCPKYVSFNKPKNEEKK